MLAVLAVLGLDAPPTNLPDKRLGSFVRNVASVGLGTRWRNHTAAKTLIDQANPHPWAHVLATARTRLREAYATALAERATRTRRDRLAAPVWTLRTGVASDSLGRPPLSGAAGDLAVPGV